MKIVTQTQKPKSPPLSSFVFRLSSFRRAFSLVEVLLAMFILGIGMIMVASVFPVGANWTRQTAEESVGQTIAQNALAVIKTHYGPNGDLRFFMNSDYLTPGNRNSILLQNTPMTQPFTWTITPFSVQALPGFIPMTVAGIFYPGIPLNERCYQFGSSNPFPAATPANCTYFWTALARLSPQHKNPTGAPGDITNGINPSASYNYDVYILVFRKGAIEHSFSTSPLEVPYTRDTINWLPMPSVVYAPWGSGQFNQAANAWTTTAVPPIGQYGIGATSGTVFKQVLNSQTYQSATPQPILINNGATVTEPIIGAPPANGTDPNASPLIYIYQTTLTF